jgi:hypothetical protein
MQHITVELSDMTNLTRLKTPSPVSWRPKSVASAGGTAHQKVACASKLILGGATERLAPITARRIGVCIARQSNSQSNKRNDIH